VVPIIYVYKEEVKQYAGRGNVILIEDGASFYIAKATKVSHDRSDLQRIKCIDR
jgi:hypothetical protein